MNKTNLVPAFAVALLVAVSSTGCSTSAQRTPEPPAAGVEEDISAAVDAKQATADAKAAAADAKADAAEAKEPVSGIVGDRLITGTATVLELDVATRHILLENDGGRRFLVSCGEGVRNLAQLKPGDSVTISYYETLVYEVKKPGDAEPSAEAAGVVGRTPLGAKPGAAGAQVVKVTATIVGIDRTSMYVTLKGVDGKLTAVRVFDAEKLARVEVGDLIEITYREALAVSVTGPSGR
jgi:hypothetical protein